MYIVAHQGNLQMVVLIPLPLSWDWETPQVTKVSIPIKKNDIN